jgi:hypothetical protein
MTRDGGRRFDPVSADATFAAVPKNVLIFALAPAANPRATQARVVEVAPR